MSAPGSRSPRRSAGTALVELCFILPLVIGLFIVIVDYGYMMYVLISMQTAVRQGCAAGQMDYQYTPAQIQQITAGADISRNVAASEVTVTTASADASFNTTLDTIEVIINHTHTFFTPTIYLDSATVALKARAKAYIVPGFRN